MRDARGTKGRIIGLHCNITVGENLYIDAACRCSLSFFIQTRSGMCFAIGMMTTSSL